MMKNKQLLSTDISYHCRKWLFEGKRLNTYDFCDATGSQRLPAFIRVLLDEKGKYKWRISKGWITRLNPRTKRPTDIKSYWLEPKEIRRIKRDQAQR